MRLPAKLAAGLTVVSLGSFSALLALRAPLPLVAGPILAIYNDSLTTYLAGAPTSIQDIEPIVGQRGVNLDGGVRSRSLLAMSLAGNPFGTPWNVAQVCGVRLSTGTYVPNDVDLSLPGEGFSWAVGRTYNARQEHSSSHVDSNGVQGRNWHCAV